MSDLLDKIWNQPEPNQGDLLDRMWNDTALASMPPDQGQERDSKIVGLYRDEGYTIPEAKRVVDGSYRTANPGETVRRDVNRRRYEGFFDELNKGLERGGERLGGGLLGTAAAGLRGIARSPIFYPLTRFGPFSAQAPRVEAAARPLEKAAQALYEDAQRWRVQPGTWGGLRGFIASTLGETLPLMASATVATIATGPVGAWAVTAASEGDNWYREALANGATAEEAAFGRVVVGTVNGVIELAQVGGILKVGKNAGAAVKREFSKQVSESVLKKMAKATGKITQDTLVNAIEEGIEEVAQGWVGEGSAIMLYDKNVNPAQLAWQSAQEFAGGATAGFFLGGGSIVLTKALETPAEQKPETPKPAMAMTPEQYATYEAAQAAEKAPEMPQAGQTPAEAPVAPETPAPAGGEQVVLSADELATQMESQTGPEALSRDLELVDGVWYKNGKLATQKDITGSFDSSERVREKGGQWQLVTINPQDVDLTRTGVMEGNVNELMDKPSSQLPPPVVEYKLGGELEKIDGAHRLAAAQRRGDTSIDVYMTVEDAQKYRAKLEPTQAPSPATVQPEATAQGETVAGPIPTATEMGGGVAWHTPLRLAMENSKEIRPKITAEQSAERSKRAGIFESTKNWYLENKKDIPAKDVLNIASSKMKGPLTDYQRFESIEDTLGEDTVNNMYLDIATTNRLRPYERLNARNALEKLLGGFVLAPYEAETLKRWQPALSDIIDARTDKSSIYKRAMGLWRAGLLTGLKTSGLNTFSNFSHAVSETMKDVPAAAFDSVQSLFTGKRTLVATTRGTVAGTKEGVRKGWNYLKTGFDERDVEGKYDYYAINYGQSKFAKGLQRYEEFVFHLMGAEDQPFYYGAKARSLYNQALAEGKNRNLTGKDLDAFIQEQVKAPSDEMLKYAALDAETAVFQNRTALGEIGSAIQRAGGEIVVPFARTPSALAMQIVNYTPVGALKESITQLRKGKYDQRTLSQAFGRATTGTALLFIGAELFKAGVMMLDYPDNERERELWQAEGRKPNSIKIGNKWRSVFVLGPVGNVLIVGGYFQREFENTGSPTNALATAVTGAAKSFSDETFLRGLNQALEAINDPERSWEVYFSNLAGSVVPTLIADIARATDTTERMAYGPGKRIKSRVPVLRETLEPRLNVFGQDVPRYGGNPLEVMADPTRPVKIRQDIVVDELRRLWDIDVRVAPTKLGNRLGYPKVLNDHENTVLWRRAGELTYEGLFALIQQPYYNRLSDDDKGKEIERVVKDAKDLARAEAASAKLETGSTITQLREGGLVTQDVQRYLGRVQRIANR